MILKLFAEEKRIEKTFKKRHMKILNANANDLQLIFQFYDFAVAYQKQIFNKHWQGFDVDMIQNEINESRIFKIIENDSTICIFSITYNDAEIWDEKDDIPSIYLHRIVTHPEHHGKHLVKLITNWAINRAKENNISCVRLDTWGDNDKLNAYYQKCGYKLIGYKEINANSSLPKHYDAVVLSLLEIVI